MSKEPRAGREEILECQVMWEPDSKKNTQMDRFRAVVGAAYGLALGSRSPLHCGIHLPERVPHLVLEPLWTEGSLARRSYLLVTSSALPDAVVAPFVMMAFPGLQGRACSISCVSPEEFLVLELLAICEDQENYDDLYHWSVESYSDFWAEFWKFSGIVFSRTYDEVVDTSKGIADVPEWFQGSRLNYAENLLQHGENDGVALYVAREGREEIEKVSFEELRRQVALYAAAMRKMGVRRGDRVIGYLPNSVHAVEAMLAATSIGAIWSSTSPDFGVNVLLCRGCSQRVALERHPRRSSPGLRLARVFRAGGSRRKRMRTRRQPGSAPATTFGTEQASSWFLTLRDPDRLLTRQEHCHRVVGSPESFRGAKF
ncbi:hypothetical protein J1605_012708 [Eschrichtius robustus]|uniref:Acetoacetyl-CoA synthetase n=1 Tax=Eschrichtius robustus TaxID=9764 RepID=A0AB34GGJ6_ESCRO|nr:hypothetical protein J1605_012708 [Eschrichtius robustus]